MVRSGHSCSWRSVRQLPNRARSQARDGMTSYQGIRAGDRKFKTFIQRRFDASKIAVSHGPKVPSQPIARDGRLPCTRCIAAAKRSHEDGFADGTIGQTCIHETLGTSEETVTGRRYPVQYIRHLLNGTLLADRTGLVTMAARLRTLLIEGNKGSHETAADGKTAGSRRLVGSGRRSWPVEATRRQLVFT